MTACNREVFERGAIVCAIEGWANDVESWVQKVAERSGQRVDWHYHDARARVLFIGDYDAVLAAVHALRSELVGRIVRIFPRPEQLERRVAASG